MVQGRAQALRGESGATLVLALVFIVAVGLVAVALVGLTGTNLITTTDLQNQRNLEFAANAGVEGAIQAVRYQAPSAPPPPMCPNYPTVGLLSVNGVSVVVECEMAVPTGFNGRIVEFDACQDSAASFAQCQASAVVRAEVVYNDAGGLGTGVTLESWVVESANG